MDTNKNNHNYTVEINFFKENVQIIHVLIYTFFKPYISKIYNGFSLYIYICVCVCVCVCVCDLKFNWFYIFRFLHPIIYLSQKLKFRWTRGGKFDSNLEYNCFWTLRFLHSILHLAQN